MKVRMLLADDHGILRQTLRVCLAQQPDFELVGEAKDGLETMAQVEKLRPDLLLLDLSMPGLPGLEVLRRVRQRFPRTRVVVLSMHKDQAYVLRALQNGASGYVLKEADAADLVHAVREVMAGRSYLSPPFTESTLEEYKKKAANGDVDPYDLLTNREKEVLQLVAEGNTNPQVGKRLFINARTVETHRAHVMEKLGLKNHAELVRFAVSRGLVSAIGPAPEAGDASGPAPGTSRQGTDESPEVWAG